MIDEPWLSSESVAWCRLLLDGYRRWLGRELIDRTDEGLVQAKALFEAPFVVVSHGTESDPILKYGNRMALALFETTWDALCRMPSRLTAEPVNRDERARMLAQAATQGYIADYRGVRISAKGRRFLVEDATVWNVVSPSGEQLGQAATFSKWTLLP